jgi:hypothetical protein
LLQSSEAAGVVAAKLSLDAQVDLLAAILRLTLRRGGLFVEEADGPRNHPGTLFPNQGRDGPIRYAPPSKSHVDGIARLRFSVAAAAGGFAKAIEDAQQQIAAIPAAAEPAGIAKREGGSNNRGSRDDLLLDGGSAYQFFNAEICIFPRSRKCSDSLAIRYC